MRASRAAALLLLSGCGGSSAAAPSAPPPAPPADHDSGGEASDDSEGVLALGELRFISADGEPGPRVHADGRLTLEDDHVGTFHADGRYTSPDGVVRARLSDAGVVTFAGMAEGVAGTIVGDQLTFGVTTFTLDAEGVVHNDQLLQELRVEGVTEPLRPLALFALSIMLTLAR